MKKNIYIQPNVHIAHIKRQPILAGSPEIPTSEEPADEWGAKQSSGFLWSDDETEE